jgi:hypothetical protein
MWESIKGINQKGFAVLHIVLILIVVAIVGFAGWYVYKANKDTNSTLNNLDNSEISITATPTPAPTIEDETADWKIYTSEKYKFSFKYPADWVVDDERLIWLYSPRPADPDTLRADIYFEEYNPSGVWSPGQSLQDYYNNAWKNHDEFTKKRVNSYSELTVQNVDVIKREWVSGPSYYNFDSMPVNIAYYDLGIHYYFIYNDLPFTVIYTEQTQNEANTASTAQDSSQWMYKDTVDKIIMSMQFE